MSDYLYHPFTFMVHALLLGAALFFAHQACVHYLLFRSSKRKSFLTYASLAAFAVVNCVVTFLPILPIGQAARVQLFHYMWIVGSLVYFTHIEALRQYLDLPPMTLRRTQGLFIGLVIVPLASSLVMMATGKPFLYDLAPAAHPGILFSAIGNPFSGNVLTAIYVCVQGGMGLFVSTAFIVLTLHSKKPDYYIVAGIAVTILALAAEMVMAGGQAYYAMPLLVFAHVIEMFRITHVSTVQMGTQVNELTEMSSRQKKIIEEQLDKLEVSEKLSALGEMTGGISHEIKGPLQTIRGYLELTEASLEEMPSFNDDEIRYYISKSSMAVDHINDIISVVNTFAMKDRAAAFKHVAVHDLVDHALNLCSFNIRCRDVTIVRKLPHEPVYVMGQRTQLIQVLINLINNACEAVTNLPERSVTVSVTTTPRSVFLSVMDSGKGIAPELRKNIGQAFYSTKGEAGGQGLGLRISSRILQRHEGRLYIDEASANTRFVVELPLRQALVHKG